MKTIFYFSLFMLSFLSASKTFSQPACIITGPDVVSPSSVNIYHTEYTNANWEVYSYDGAEALIVFADSNSVTVNAGNTPGKYTVYRLSLDTSGIPLCSLNVNVDATLPVELVSFTSEITGRDVILKWTTSSEENNSGFYVERNISDEWTIAGFVSGSGNSDEQRHYSFTDRDLHDGSYRYRLKQIDFNGNFKYYVLANEVVIGKPHVYSLSPNYPNPFNPVTTITFGLPEGDNVVLKIYDVNGREISELINEFREAGYYTTFFNASNLPSGIYFYRLETGSFMQTRKMTLIK